jgi:hypothetical protein
MIRAFLRFSARSGLDGEGTRLLLVCQGYQGLLPGRSRGEGAAIDQRIWLSWNHCEKWLVTKLFPALRNSRVCVYVKELIRISL